MYIYHKEKDYKAFSSLKALSDYTGINYDTLTYQFSRNKVKRFNKENAIIVRTKTISSKRKIRL